MLNARISKNKKLKQAVLEGPIPKRRFFIFGKGTLISLSIRQLRGIIPS